MNNIDFSSIPSKEILLEDEKTLFWIEGLGRPLVSGIIDGVIREIREQADSNGIPPAEDILDAAARACRRTYRRRVIRVINGTGILLHTNMGRSPVLEEAWDACRSVNTSYSNLEFNLETGKRGKRNGLVPDLLSCLTGAEASMVVNNNAAAVYLVLSVLAAGKEVIVSRGEQVQIGGGFRIPEILALSGAQLVEVGTTNITTLSDYKNALSDHTACILSVHRSNFAIRGFTSRPPLSEIRSILPEGVFLFVDQGSGALNENIKGETEVGKILKTGADLVSFSCDKVLGGPQGGIIAGRKGLVDTLEHHQLYRVFRPGKTIYSLLEEILVRKINGASFLGKHFSINPYELKKRAAAVSAALPEGSAEVVQTSCSTGGGSSPDETFPSVGLRFSCRRPDRLLESLRNADTPIIGYISGGSAYIDFAALSPSDDAVIAKTATSALSGMDQ